MSQIKEITDMILKMGNLISGEKLSHNDVAQRYSTIFSGVQLKHTSENGGKVASNRMCAIEDIVEFDEFDRIINEIRVNSI
jgi:hypothetical protein